MPTNCLSVGIARKQIYKRIELDPAKSQPYCRLDSLRAYKLGARIAAKSGDKIAEDAKGDEAGGADF